MATGTVGVSELADVDTGRLEGASRLRVILIVMAIVAATEIVAFQTAFISLSARYVGASFPSAGTQLPWLNTAHALVGGVAVPVAGKLSDLIGKKKVILGCLLVSLVGSVIDATTTSWTVMLVGRALQGLAIPAFPVAFGLVRDLAPRRMVNLAISIAGSGTGVLAVLGPLAGGVLTDHYSWRSLFWFCVIYSAVTIIPMMLFVPETKLRAKVRLDLPGTVLLGTGIALIMIYVSQGSAWGWSRATTLGWLFGGLALLAVFYAWETRTSQPIMSPALLRSRRLVSILVYGFVANALVQGISYVVGFIAESPGGAQGNAVKQQIINGAAQEASQQSHRPVALFTPLFSVQGDLPGLNLTLFQFVLKVTLVLAILYVLVSPLVGWLSTRTGLQKPASVSMLAFGVGSLLLVYFHSSVLELALITVLIGVGAGTFLGTAPNLLVEAVPQEQQGISAGMYGAFTSFGSATATALVASVSAAHPLVLHSSIPGHVQNTPLNKGQLAQLPAGSAYTVLFVIFACVAVAGLVLTLFMRHFRHPATGGTRY